MLKSVQISKEHDHHSECHLTGIEGVKWLMSCGPTSQEDSWGTWEKDSTPAVDLLTYWGNYQTILQGKIKRKKRWLR